MSRDAPAEDPASEIILCDTSFVSIVQSAGAHRAAIEAWPQEVRARLDRAVLAISVITLAELRDGHLYAGWTEPRRLRAEQVIDSYLHVPLDMSIVDRCAELRTACRRVGVSTPDNDVWIAATAQAREWPLVSCDGHFDLIPGCDHIRLAAM